MLTWEPHCSNKSPSNRSPFRGDKTTGNRLWAIIEVSALREMSSSPVNVEVTVATSVLSSSHLHAARRPEQEAASSRVGLGVRAPSHQTAGRQRAVMIQRRWLVAAHHQRDVDAAVEAANAPSPGVEEAATSQRQRPGGVAEITRQVRERCQQQKMVGFCRCWGWKAGVLGFIGRLLSDIRPIFNTDSDVLVCQSKKSINQNL